MLAINPTKLIGTIHVPPSKSMAHRAIICASLAKGKSRIQNIAYSVDIMTTIMALRELGSKIVCYEDYVEVDGVDMFTKKDVVLDCRESGSTLRFLIPISLVRKNTVHFIGADSLGKRPLDPYYKMFDVQGVLYEYKENILDLKVNGCLKSDHFTVAGTISSQFISGLLFALPLLDEDSIINVEEPFVSTSYIDLTLDMLKRFSIQVERLDKTTFKIYGNQEYKATDYIIEGDYSQAAFYFAAGALGNQVTITGLNSDTLQGDKVMISILETMGASIHKAKEGMVVDCELLHSTMIDGSNCIDLIPIIAVICSVAKGTSVITNIERLRYKECDRLTATIEGLQQLGANIKEDNGSLVIQGVKSLDGGKIATYNDHRMAMSFAIASTICKDTVLLDYPNCVSKSYPTFWEDFKKLGGDFYEC